MPLVKHPNIHNTLPFSKNSPSGVGNGDGRQVKKTGYLYSNIHSTRSFSKAHSLMLAMEKTDKERNRLPLVEHPNIYITHDLSVKLTFLCWQWCEQTKREIDYFSHTCKYNSHPDIHNEASKQERNKLLLVKHSHIHNTRPSVKLTF